MMNPSGLSWNRVTRLSSTIILEPLKPSGSISSLILTPGSFGSRRKMAWISSLQWI